MITVVQCVLYIRIQVHCHVKPFTVSITFHLVQNWNSNLATSLQILQKHPAE